MDNNLPPNPPPPTTIDDPLTNPYTTHDLSTLYSLSTRGAWNTILDKVNHARSSNLLTKPHEHLTYLTFNTLALTKLRRDTDALKELDTLLEETSKNNDYIFDPFDSPQFYYQTYPQHYPNNIKGCFVPFALRFLHATLPHALGQRVKALDRLYALRGYAESRKIESLSGPSREIWERREVFVLNSIISYHLMQKEFTLVLDLMGELVGLCGARDRPYVVSKLGYVKMQYGDVEGAKAAFKMVEEMVVGRESEGENDLGLRNLVSRNKALCYITEKDYVSAVREYEECIERDGADVVATNNKALCLMYSRDLSDAIKVLENALERVPTVALNETLVVNLCSMYELAYVNHADVKRTLNTWIARVAPDDFDSSCTRT